MKYIPKTKKVYESENYVIILDIVTGIHELYQKDIGDDKPIATHKLSCVLALVAKQLEKYDQIIHNCSSDKETYFNIGVNYDNENRVATYTNMTTGKTWQDDLKVNRSMRYIARQVS